MAYIRDENQEKSSVACVFRWPRTPQASESPSSYPYSRMKYRSRASALVSRYIGIRGQLRILTSRVRGSCESVSAPRFCTAEGPPAMMLKHEQKKCDVMSPKVPSIPWLTETFLRPKVHISAVSVTGRVLPCLYHFFSQVLAAPTQTTPGLQDGFRKPFSRRTTVFALGFSPRQFPPFFFLNHPRAKGREREKACQR